MQTDELTIILSLGALVGLGVFLLVLFFVGSEPQDAEIKPKGFSLSDIDFRSAAIRLAMAVVAFIILMAVTQWVVLAVAVGLLVGFWKRIFGGAAEERRAIERLEGLSGWTESLRDTIAGAVGLEQAIPATAVNAAPVIRPSLNLLVDRLRVREPLPTALMKFADDLDDPSADLIIAALILNARLRGPGLRDVLSALSESGREELDLRRRVEGSRRSTRRSVQIVVGVTLFVSGLLILFNQSYLEPYDGPVGQIVLTGVIGLFAAGVFWLRRLAGVDVPERFLIQSSRKGTDRLDVVTGGAGR
ncbi:MAG: type II secretion system F family protein [Nocardioidaceae bacterium]